MRTVAAIAVVLALAGCQTTRTVTTAVPLAERIPLELRSCAAEPGAPDPDASTQADLVAWTARLRDAGADCRAKVGALDELVGRS
ncbi:hypothetical protein [Aureimonas sp. AU40]|uniref:hypothetical protein n=1 Tax=Aureimonas sp. AU40 TaxID=1637747 RepID=UPI00078564E0|nr:hypothetical protein [Aureimonas sp. AU40]